MRCDLGSGERKGEREPSDGDDDAYKDQGEGMKESCCGMGMGWECLPSVLVSWIGAIGGTAHVE